MTLNFKAVGGIVIVEAETSRFLPQQCQQNETGLVLRPVSVGCFLIVLL